MMEGEAEAVRCIDHADRANCILAIVVPQVAKLGASVPPPWIGCLAPKACKILRVNAPKPTESPSGLPRGTIPKPTRLQQRMRTQCQHLPCRGAAQGLVLEQRT